MSWAGIITAFVLLATCLMPASAQTLGPVKVADPGNWNLHLAGTTNQAHLIPSGEPVKSNFGENFIPAVIALDGYQDEIAVVGLNGEYPQVRLLHTGITSNIGNSIYDLDAATAYNSDGTIHQGAFMMAYSQVDASNPSQHRVWVGVVRSTTGEVIGSNVKNHPTPASGGIYPRITVNRQGQWAMAWAADGGVYVTFGESGIWYLDRNPTLVWLSPPATQVDISGDLLVMVTKSGANDQIRFCRLDWDARGINCYAVFDESHFAYGLDPTSTITELTAFKSWNMGDFAAITWTIGESTLCDGWVLRSSGAVASLSNGASCYSAHYSYAEIPGRNGLITYEKGPMPAGIGAVEFDARGGIVLAESVTNFDADWNPLTWIEPRGVVVANVFQSRHWYTQWRPWTNSPSVWSTWLPWMENSGLTVR